MTNDSSAERATSIDVLWQSGTEQIKVLLYVNAGAIVVLLAFLQAMWEFRADVDTKELIAIILKSMGLFTLGTCAILPAHVFRIKMWSRTVNGFFYTSMALFFFGAGYLIIGAIQLPLTP